jgi:hypothetical protein
VHDFRRCQVVLKSASITRVVITAALAPTTIAVFVSSKPDLDEPFSILKG